MQHIPNFSLATEIYRYKIDSKIFQSEINSVQLGRTIHGSGNKPKMLNYVKIRNESKKIAKIFGVDARTVRDIWKRKSWVNATKHLWGSELMIPEVSQVNIDVDSMQVSALALLF